MKQKSVDSLSLIKDNYVSFSKYTMKNRTYPSLYDGCKIAQRRVLWSAFSKAPKSMVKLSSMCGFVIQVHPHAEATDVIVNMGGQYKTAFPMFDTKGNWGDNFGNPASAPRYLECKLNSFARNNFFKLIDYAPFENFEVESEPLYLPTLFPLALLQGCYSIGQGTPNPLIPDLDYNDLKNFVKNYIKTGKKEVSKTNFVRPVDYDKIRDDKNKDQSIIDLLNTGKGSVYYSPNVELKDNKITVSNLYVLANFNSLMSKFATDIKEDKIDVMDVSGEERVFIIEKVKNKSYDMEDCAKKVKQMFTFKENYAMYFHDENGHVKPYSLGEIIENCYNRYKEAFEKKLLSDIEKHKQTIVQLQCLADMSKHTNVVIDNKLTIDEKAEKLSKLIAYDKDVIVTCLHQPIHRLKEDKKALEVETKTVKEVEQSLDNIGKTILDTIN